ncbi:MAG: TetR family transcriptional regulator [Pseudonocardiales bacterium]|nr:MAG: TetR family transcriptional regulator [Pseudonocardiales bacterium]
MPRRSQQDRTRSTQAALMATARQLFAERGYAQVPADELVAAAGVTRGAMYHHYADKKALFEAVFEALETEITQEIAEVADGATDAWTSVVGAVARYLDICQRPEVIQIALTDAPGVLGWQRWREIEAVHGLGLITSRLQVMADQGVLVAAPVPVLAQIALSAVTEAALIIAHADDRAAARDAAQQSLLALLGGMVGH